MEKYPKYTKEKPTVIPKPKTKPQVPIMPEIIPNPEKIEPITPNIPEAPPLIVPDIEPNKETYDLGIRNN